MDLSILDNLLTRRIWINVKSAETNIVTKISVDIRFFI